MSFDAAYGLYYAQLVRSMRRQATALRISDRDVDVEALVQDTFEEALRVWSTIRIPRAWLYTVARRRLGRCVREAALRVHGEPADHAEQGTVRWSTMPLATNTEDLIAAREIVAVIQTMPQQRRREVAYLRFLREWEFNEIAEELGCCPSTARVHALRARDDIAPVLTSDSSPLIVSSNGTASPTFFRLGVSRRFVSHLGLALLVAVCAVLMVGWLTGFAADWLWALAAVAGLLGVRAMRAWHYRRI